jgi:hypothetical protein
MPKYIPVSAFSHDVSATVFTDDVPIITFTGDIFPFVYPSIFPYETTVSKYVVAAYSSLLQQALD